MRNTWLAIALLAAPAVSQDWGNLGGNAARNGAAPGLGPTGPDVLWSNTDDFSIIAWHPYVLGDRVFTIREAGFPQNGGAANDALVAYDLDTGVEAWRITLPFGGDTSQEWIAWIAGVNGGRVYASRSSNGQPQPIHAYDAGSGAFVWTSALSTQAWAHDGVVFAPDGDLFVGDFSQVARIEASDGSTVWSVPRLCPVSGNCGMAMSDTGLFIDEPRPGATNRLTKLDPATGATLYSTVDFPGFTTQNTPFVSRDGNTVYFARTQNNVAVDFLYAFQDTGAALVELWHVPVRWTTSHEHGIAPDGTIYTFSQADELVRLDPSNGSVIDNAGVLAPFGSPGAAPKTVVDADGRVYVSNGWASTPATNGRVWAFDASLSQNLFTLTLDRQNQGGPVLGRDGTLVVADRAGVYAYRTTPGSAFCAGDGNGIGVCPCGNLGAPGSGCDTPQGTGGVALTVAGFAPDGSGGGALTLGGSGFPAMSSPAVVAIRGSALAGPIAFGDGVLCLEPPTVVRIGTTVAAGGTSTHALSHGAGAGSFYYQLWFRSTPSTFCTPNAFNASNGRSLLWH